MRVFGVFTARLLVAGCKSRPDSGATAGGHGGAGRPVPLFAGSDTAIVHGSVSVPQDALGPATVVAGTTTTLRH